jgi:hypothetical protein
MRYPRFPRTNDSGILRALIDKALSNSFPTFWTYSNFSNLIRPYPNLIRPYPNLLRRLGLLFYATMMLILWH